MALEPNPSAAAPENISARKPPALHPGDSIGVIAPASAPHEMAPFTRGCAHLEELGYHLEKGRPSYTRHGYLSGSDTERLKELNEMLGRPDLKALFCSRGGYGTLRLLPGIDYQAARRHPKLIVGYSDITALQLALYRHTGIPGLSGPMIAPDWADLDSASEQQFWELASGGAPQVIRPTDGSHPHCIRTGIAKGRLIGGNLTMLTRLLGTPYFPSVRGAILYVEDVGEPPYRIDGMLAQLRLSGVLGDVNGMIFGCFTESAPNTDRPSLSLEEVIDTYSRFVSGPVISDFTYGHCRPKTTLPLGVTARLIVEHDHAELTMLEPVVEDS